MGRELSRGPRFSASAGLDFAREGAMNSKPTHGGSRPNAGRKPQGDQPRNVTRSVKLTAEEAEYISEVGTGELWRLLQDSKGYQEWKAKRCDGN